VKRLSDKTLAAMVLLVALTIAFANVIFGGRSLVATNSYNGYGAAPSEENHELLRHFEESARRNLVPYANYRDPGVAWWQWEPSGEFLRKAIRDGEFPLWDPYAAAGAPAMSNLTGCFFFPPYFLMVLAGNGILLQNVYFLFLFFIAGYFTFLLLRAHGLSMIACLTAAIGFMFSGSIATSVNTMLGQTWACVPFALYLTYRLLERPTVARVAALAAGYAAVALSSFPPLLVALFGTCAVYAVVAILYAERAIRPRIAACYAGGCALALCLVAFYYLPVIGVSAAVPQVHQLYDYAGSLTLPLKWLHQLLSPYLTGGIAPVLAESPFPFAMSGYPYVGVTIAALALISWPAERRQRALYVSMVTALLLVILKMAGFPAVHWIGRLPMFRSIHYVPYFSYATNFFLAVMAGFGMERLLRGHTRPARSLLATMILLVAVIALAGFAIRNGFSANPHFASWLAGWRVLTLSSAVVAIALALGSAARRARWLAVAAGIAFATLCVEAYIYTVYPRPLRWDPWRNPPRYVRQLSTQPADRILSMGGLHANASSAFGIYGLGSLYVFNPPRVHRLYHEYLNPDPAAFMEEPQLFPSERLLDAAAITQIVTHESSANALLEILRRGYVLAYRDQGYSVFRRISRPRHFFTTDYRVLPAPKILRILGNETNQRPLLLEQPPSFVTSPDHGAAPVSIRKMSRNGYVLALTAPRPGLLYSAESFFPGWTAKVNGITVPILTADYAFRAVEVPAGPVIVEYRYEPRFLKAGFALSAAALLVCVALPVVSRRRRILNGN
jgi:hypothetical protein